MLSLLSRWKFWRCRPKWRRNRDQEDMTSYSRSTNTRVQRCKSDITLTSHVNVLQTMDANTDMMPSNIRM